MIAYMSGSARDIETASSPHEWWEEPVEGVVPAEEIEILVRPVQQQQGVVPLAIGAGILGALALFA